MARPTTTAGRRAEKAAVVSEVQARFGAAAAAVLTEYRGLTVAELAKLRAELRRTDAEYKIVKNTLTRRAVSEAGIDLPEALLNGPTAITFCAGDPVAAAKVLRAFSREHPSLVIKGGIFEGRALDAEETLRLADLASREELLSRLAGLFEAAVAQPARLALASITKMARLLAAYQQKREEAGETAEAPASPEQPAEEQPAEAAEEQPVEAAPEQPVEAAPEQPVEAAPEQPVEAAEPEAG